MEKEIYLNDIYQNAQMGIVGIDEVIYKVKKDILYNELLNEKKEYKKIIKECKKIAKRDNITLKDVGMMARIGSEIFSEIKLMKDNNDELINKMMIEGSYKSIGVLTTKIMENKDSDEEINNLAKKLLKIINENVEQLKKI